MRKIYVNEKNNVTGLVKPASAAEYINEGIFGYLLETEEEQAEAYPFNTALVVGNICEECEGCRLYTFLLEGIQCPTCLFSSMKLIL